MWDEKETTAPNPSVGADGEQSSALARKDSIANESQNRKSDADASERMRRVALGEMPTMTMTELMGQHFSPRPAVVDGLLPMGTYLFTGAPKIGKSFFILQMAYQISRGETFLGFTTRRGTALYLALEDTYERLQRRLYRMTEEESEKLVLSAFSGTLEDGLIDQMKSFLRHNPDTVLIAIDTLQKVRPKGGKVYSYASDYEVMAQLKVFADQYDIALILVHHTRKESAEDVFDTISGTNGLMGAADGAFVLHKDKPTATDAVLDVSSRDQQDIRLQLSFDRVRCIWALVKLETELYKEPPNPLFAAIGHLVTEAAPEWSGTATELADCLGHIQTDLSFTSNWIVRTLNIQQDKLLNEQGIRYVSRRTRDGKSILLQRECVR